MDKHESVMKRITITLDDIAEYKNVSLAAYKAAKRKRHRPEVQHFFEHYDAHLNQLCADIRDGKLPYGNFRSFTIHDPKQRLIHAACFEDRVFHHALMNICGATFERAMVDNSYACRKGKGVHLAVKQVQRHLRAYPWYVKIDIDGYFPAINHQILHRVLMRKFKGKEISRQFWRILQVYESTPACGLPIGALTSQYFANDFLDQLDRQLSENRHVRAYVRYMDDMLWWCDTKQTAIKILAETDEYLTDERGLRIKPNVQIQRSQKGVSYCGYRILQDSIRLSRRRKKRYQERRLYWENEYQQGRINALQLQSAYAAVHSITVGTDSLQWRKQNLQRFPSIDV